MRPEHRRTQLLQLLTKARIRISDAAVHLGVSVRTVHRDVARLRADGYRVGSAPGPRGGVWLGKGSRPAPLSLAVAAVRQLVTHLVATGAEALVAPLLEGLPPQVRHRLEALVRGIEPTGRVEHLDDATLACVESAFDDRWPLGFTRKLGVPGRYHTVAFPLAMHLSEGRWVIRGVRRDEQEAEDFRLSDLQQVRRHGLPWVAPRGVSRRYRTRRPDDPPALTHRRSIWSGHVPPWATGVVR